MSTLSETSIHRSGNGRADERRALGIRGFRAHPLPHLPMHENPVPMNMIEKDRIYCTGTMKLDLDRRELSGPRGAILIAPVLFAIMERLMRRPGVVVEHSSLISAIWPEPDDEPDEPMATIKDKIKNLRGAINVLGCYGPDGVEIRCERDVGYFLRTRTRNS